MVVVINGIARSGKDSFMDFCEKYIEVHRIDTVAIVKITARMLGWDTIKDEKGRKFLSELKRLSIEYWDHPFKYTCEWIKKLERPKNLVFVVVREPEEIQKIVSFCKENEIKCTTIYLYKPDNQIPNNPSDMSAPEFVYDELIMNDSSLEELDKKAKKFVCKFLNVEEL